MAFDSTQATPAELESRLLKFKRLASKMSAEHFQKVLHSFPVEHQDAVVLAVKENGPTDFFRPVPPTEPVELVYYREDRTPSVLQQINDTLKTIKENQ